MRHIFLIAIIATALIVSTARASSIAAQGTTTGGFSDAICVTAPCWTDSSNQQWLYGLSSGASKIYFSPNGAFYAAPDSSTVNLGILHFQNANTWTPSGIDDPSARYTADLNVHIAFSNPAGQSTNLTWELALQTLHGGADTLTLPTTFAPIPLKIDGTAYNFSILGFYDRKTGNKVSQFTAGSPWGYETADLRASLTKLPSGSVHSPPPAHAPEPATAVLLLPAAAALVWFKKARKGNKSCDGA